MQHQKSLLGMRRQGHAMRLSICDLPVGVGPLLEQATIAESHSRLQIGRVYCPKAPLEGRNIACARYRREGNHIARSSPIPGRAIVVGADNNRIGIIVEHSGSHVPVVRRRER